MKSFSIFDVLKKKKDLERLIESTTVTYDTINESYVVNNDYLEANIKLYQNEGAIPHFHVKFNGHEACFCLFEAKYYNHEDHHVMMNDNHLYGLNVFLMSPTRQESNPKQSWWDFLVSLWVEYAANRDYEHKSDWKRISKPNYNNTKINKYNGPNNHCKKKY